MPQLICIVNKSTLLSYNDLLKASAAIQRQLVGDLGPAWNAGAILHVTQEGEPPIPGAWMVTMVDQSTDAGALGFHQDAGTPSGEIGVKTSIDDGVEWSAVLSHELCELVVDPLAQVAYQVGADFWALEACDPVESSDPTYIIDGVQVENFILPVYFRAGSSGPWDFRKQLAKPLSLTASGYQMTYSGGAWGQLNGDTVRGCKRKMGAASRRARRATVFGRGQSVIGGTP